MPKRAVRLQLNDVEHAAATRALESWVGAGNAVFALASVVDAINAVRRRCPAESGPVMGSGLGRCLYEVHGTDDAHFDGVVSWYGE
jgi:hypothetical protein